MSADILQLLNDVGVSTTLTRVTPGAYDTATGDSGAETTEEWTIRTTFVSYKSRELVGDRETFGTRILAGDRKALVATPGLATNPATGDFIEYAGATWTVISVQTIDIGGLPIVFVCQVRHGVQRV
jgi:hypothetical protein